MAMSRAKRPRDNQKQRTRAALVEAALEAVRRGEAPTLEESAEAARVSRATAYRYFASKEALLLETSLEAMSDIPDATVVAEGPVESRVDAAIRGLLRMSYENELYLRAFLKYSMEQWLKTRKDGNGNCPVRKGRRLGWLDRALAPLKLPPARKRRLRMALSMLCGIEAVIVATDVCRCTAKEAEAASRWAAQALLRAAVEEMRA